MTKPGIGKFFSSLSLNRKLKSKDIADLPAPKAVAVGPAPAPPVETLGPGRGGEFEKVLTTKDGIRKALIVARPPPNYTELARQHEINGTVVLRAIFRSSGQVTDIRAVSGQPYGLTEQAIKAARTIKFIPAIKDGRYVSMYVHLEYNFSLY
jgi:TonB family protein